MKIGLRLVAAVIAELRWRCQAECPPNVEYCPVPLTGMCMECCPQSCVPFTVTTTTTIPFDPSSFAPKKVVSVTDGIVTSSVPGFRSKCGIVTQAEGGFTPAMLMTANANGLAWQTNWKPFGPQDGFTAEEYGQVKSVPQFWGLGETGDSFRQVEPPLVPVMLGYNEPDQADLGGANMDVYAALDGWMNMVGKAKLKGYTEFVAPSIAKALPSRYTGANDDTCDNCEWYPIFLEACLLRAGCKETVNYLGFHMYEPNCNSDPASVKYWNYGRRVGSMKMLMQEFNAKGMNIKGLWLTEFAGRSGNEASRCKTWEGQKAWMEVFVPMLNADPAVVAYSWFSYDAAHSPYFHDDASLFDYNTGLLSPLGEAYFTACQTLPRPTPAPVAPPADQLGIEVGIAVVLFLAICCWCCRGKKTPRARAAEPLLG